MAATEEQPSHRLIDQRVRNRTMEAVEVLADGDDGVRRVGNAEYLEAFCDWIPHRSDGAMRPNGALTGRERSLLLEVSKALDDACYGVSGNTGVDASVAAGWPKRIQSVALLAFNVMRERGRFSGEHEPDLAG